MDRLGRDELFYKIADRHDDEALNILSEMDTVNFKDANSYSYLHIAVQSESVRIVQFLLEKGAEINAADKFGRTPLMIAISGYNGDRTIIDLLLKNGASLDSKANSGVPCMQLAKIKGLSL